MDTSRVFSLKPRRHLIPPDTVLQLAEWLRTRARNASGRSLLLLGLDHEDDQLKAYDVGLLCRQIGLKWAERGLSVCLIDGPGVDVADQSVRTPLANYKSGSTSIESGWQWWQYQGWPLLHGVSRLPGHVQPWPTPPWPSAYGYTLITAAQDAIGLDITPQDGFSPVGWPCEDIILVRCRRERTRRSQPIPESQWTHWQQWAQSQGLYLQGVIDVRMG